MSRIQEIKNEIEVTNADLEEKIKIMQNEAQETVEMVKDAIEQGAEHVRELIQKVSPVYQMKRHPGVAQGALFALGILLAGKTAEKNINWNDSSNSSKVPRTKALLQPIALGVATAIAGEVLKARLPMYASKVGAIQSALITEMSHKFLRHV